MFEEIQDKELAQKMLSRQNKAFMPELFVKFKPKECFLHRNFVHQYQDIRDFEVRNDDVWVISFIKAGTTWTQEMVWLLNQDLDFVGAKKNLGVRYRYFENDSYDSEKRLVVAGIIAEDNLAMLKNINAMPSPRYVKTHLPFNLLPKQIQTGQKRPKIIYVARNPKHVCVSLFHHRVLVEGFKGTLDDLVDEFVSDLVYFAPYRTHVEEFWNRRNDSNIHFITYEAMKKDLPAVIKGTAEFLGKSFTDLQYESLSRHLSFDSMKVNPAANNSQLTEYLRSLHGEPRNNEFICKGTAGAWKEELGEESVKKLDDWISKHEIDGIWNQVQVNEVLGENLLY